ncbi:MAG: DUF4349 domain-containing protein [Caldilineales bacterium]|nr:DUF4349 domain-containing protein [Caldilineales bacterium]
MKINQQLTQVEQEIEQLKGRANWLQQRAAFSIIACSSSPNAPPQQPAPTLHLRFHFTLVSPGSPAHRARLSAARAVVAQASRTP